MADSIEYAIRMEDGNIHEIRNDLNDDLETVRLIYGTYLDALKEDGIVDADTGIVQRTVTKTYTEWTNINE